MLTAETPEAMVWLCFKVSWGQWSSYSSFPQLVEIRRLELVVEGSIFCQEFWDIAGECACKDSRRREHLLILLRKEEMESKLGQVTLVCFVFSLLLRVGLGLSVGA